MTLRELLWMSEGRGRESWTHTSAILAMLANVNRDPKKNAIAADHFNPYVQKREATRSDMAFLKQSLTATGKRKHG